MEFKDYYAALGVEKTATAEEIKRAYRKLARKYHPDVSKEPDAEARFKDVAEAYEALHDPEKRAAYDDIGARHRDGPSFTPPPGWDSGFEYSGRGDPDGAAEHSDFFESLFGRQSAGARRPRSTGAMAGGDHHAKVQIDLADTYRGGRHAISLRVPQTDAQGRTSLQTRQLDVNIARGVRSGQHLRLAGQGGPGFGDGPAGDLYLEIEIAPHPHFRVDDRDVYLDLPVAPWEAALGASVTVPTPDGSVQLTVPPGSAAGRRLRLKGKGIPSQPPGDLYVVLTIALPPADTEAAQAAYRAFAQTCVDFNPRRALEA
ncbi:MAG: DnaJ C-terminal domain-containing protein [Pseudomonadota bacterium]|nr:DnaJ C-terminal domain-containing protein [Pseudomonadota bacterium]